MTTFAELKATLSDSILGDPSHKVFSTTDLGVMVNAALAECSRIAPQRFVEDITPIASELRYRLRGGNSNLIQNPSFEDGEDDMFKYYRNLTQAEVLAQTSGWQTSAANLRIQFPKDNVARRKTGLHTLLLLPENGDPQANLYQDIPVNPDTTYVLSGWHCKGQVGTQNSYIKVHALDDALAVVQANVISHATTAATMQYAQGSYTTPSGGTVAFLRVELLTESDDLGGAGYYFFEDIGLVESGQTALVTDNAASTIEVKRVEVWDGSLTPEAPCMLVPKGAAEYVDYSDTGWHVWNGFLYLPSRYIQAIDPSTQFIRVWGYAPYDKLTTNAQVTDLGNELEYAVLVYAQIVALRRLVMSRDLFTQWQTRPGNTDVSPASLMSALNLAIEEWRRMKRELAVLRE